MLIWKYLTEDETKTSVTEPEATAEASSSQPKTCRFYKIREISSGQIISWKYDADNDFIIVKRNDGIRYFRRRFKELSTLPKCEINQLAQLKIINRAEHLYGDLIESIVRKEINSNQFFLLKPNLRTRYIYRNRVHPVTKPWVKVVYRAPKTLKKIPLEKLPLNFLKRLKYWHYYQDTGETIIEYILESEPEDKWKGLKIV